MFGVVVKLFVSTSKVRYLAWHKITKRSLILPLLHTNSIVHRCNGIGLNT